MDIQTYKTYHLVKSEDLNHHGTLYAGRSAEWFVESGFIAASSLTCPAETVCLQIHGMMFKSPVHLGEIVGYESRVVYTGRTKIVTYICVKRQEQVLLDGFITFIHVDETGHSVPHGIEIVARTPEEQALQQRAMGLFEKK
jgi:acyl-CoA hydrolase